MKNIRILLGLLVSLLSLTCNPGMAQAASAEEANKTSVSPPRAVPYALPVGAGKVDVTFHATRLDRADGQLYLRRSGQGVGVQMNDLGRAGDSQAGDGVYAATITVDTADYKPDTCIAYRVYRVAKRGVSRSAPFDLCVSSLPLRAAASDKKRLVKMDNGTVAVADELLWMPTAHATVRDIAAVAQAAGGNVAGRVPVSGVIQIRLDGPADAARLAGLIARLERHPAVAHVSVNAVGSYAYTPNDPEYPAQHGLQRVRAQDAWDIAAAGTGVTVTVLDSGLDRSHADFGTPGDCQLAENDCGAASSDLLGHGTQVAGVVAAKTNNTLGVAGFAYGSKLHAIQLSPDAVITDLEMIQGFNDAAAYVAAHGQARVVNASFSVLNAFANWPGVCAAIDSLVQVAGVPRAIVVNAVGNQGNNGFYYPARCNDLQPALTRKELLITVANSVSLVHTDCASAALDQRCSTSNYGPWVDIAAPGSVIRSSALGGGYVSQTGTSFAAPMVSGAAAILSACGVPLDQIENTLRSSANVTVTFPVGSAPRLDIYRALQQRDRAPTGLNMPAAALNEGTDTTAGLEVGSLSAVDPDSCDHHSYSIVGGADAAHFSIGGVASDRLRLSAGILDYETQTHYDVIVRVTDFNGLSFDQALTVNVNDLNDTPPVITTPAAFNVNENTAFSVPLTSTDADTAGIHPAIFSISGGADAARFSIVGTDLVLPVQNYEAPADADANNTYVVQLSASDGVNTTLKLITVTVNNVNDPPTGLPYIDGNRTVGQTLTAQTASSTLPNPIADEDGLGVFHYQWMRGSTPVGTDSATYTLLAADLGAYMAVCVSYTDGGGHAEQVCSGADALAVGDPHLITVDGLHYDFQSAGEFVALRGSDDLEIQTRQTPVSTATAITDPYSGLSAAVSVNTAVAARVGKHRVTMQMSGASAAAVMLVRVDGLVTAVPPNGRVLGLGGRLQPLPGGAIQLDFPDQTTLIVTPGWWAPHALWYLNLTVLHTSAYEGLMGARGAGSWLPRLSDGTVLGAMPATLPDRYEELYVRFADSWRVNEQSSLFDHGADTSPATYTWAGWPRIKPPYVATRPVARPVKRAVAEQACRAIQYKLLRQDCVFDVMVTGNVGFARTYQTDQRIRAGLTRTRLQAVKNASKDMETRSYIATVEADITPLTRVAGKVPTGTIAFLLDGRPVARPVKLDARGQARVELDKTVVQDLHVMARYLPDSASSFLPSASPDESLRLSKPTHK